LFKSKSSIGKRKLTEANKSSETAIAFIANVACNYFKYCENLRENQKAVKTETGLLPAFWSLAAVEIISLSLARAHPLSLSSSINICICRYCYDFNVVCVAFVVVRNFGTNVATVFQLNCMRK